MSKTICKINGKNVETMSRMTKTKGRKKWQIEKGGMCLQSFLQKYFRDQRVNLWESLGKSSDLK